jgi:hypothetical protein
MDATLRDRNESINGISVGLLLGYTKLTNLKGRTCNATSEASKHAGRRHKSVLFGYVYNLYITLTRFTRCNLDSGALLCAHLGKAPWFQRSEAFRPLRLDGAISLNRVFPSLTGHIAVTHYILPQALEYVRHQGTRCMHRWCNVAF